MIETRKIFILIIIILLTLIHLFNWIKKQCKNNNKFIIDYEFMKQIKPDKPDIYCLMVTGKDDNRYKFAKIAIKNFNMQTYKNKYLVIINHGKHKLNVNQKNVIEQYVDKTDKTLGDLRNVSLSFVPKDAIWTTWDDDDWRHEVYLEKLYENLTKNSAKMLMIKNRMDCNLTTKYIWESTMKSGLIWFFGFKNDIFKFESLDTLEDNIIKTQIEQNNVKTIIYDNDPRLYIRFVHTNNTSPYVSIVKYDVLNYAPDSDYKENYTTDERKDYVRKIIEEHYADLTLE